MRSRGHKFVLSMMAVTMMAVFMGWSGGPSAAADPELGAPVPAPGQAVVHRFDVVIANLFDDPGQIPPDPPAPGDYAKMDAALGAAAQWWSNNTGLAFDFTTGTRYATINSTCRTLEKDAMAALGKPYESVVYTESGDDLLIVQTGGSCGMSKSLDGITLTVSSTGNVFAGGIFEVAIGPSDNNEVTAFTVAHGFGHTIGLAHSNIDDCRDTHQGDDQVGPLWGTVRACRPEDQRDDSTIMGGQFAFTEPVHVGLNTLQKQYLGVAWGDVAVVDRPATRQIVTISRMDVDSDLPHGLEVSAPDGVFTGALEYRPASPLFVTPGVYLTVADASSLGMRTSLATPAGLTNNIWQDIAFPVPLSPGDPYVSSDGSVRLRTLSVDDTTARVEVTVTKQPGLPGEVSISQTAGKLTAKPVIVGAETDVSYQWFRNGKPIPGATQAGYAPDLPDPNAVYRVEAAYSLPGYATTTRYSRGIIPDDHRLEVNGTDIAVSLLDQNGRPVDCDGMWLSLDIVSPGGSLGGQLFQVQYGGVFGVCHVPWQMPLTGPLLITASNPVDQPVEITWHSIYWAPATAAARIGADRAAAGLMVGLVKPPLVSGDFPPGNRFMDPMRPMLLVGAGDPPMAVTVSATDAAGAPAAGLPVSLSSDSPGLVFTPAAPVTDEYGFALATVDWDRSAPPPGQCRDSVIKAGVPGVAVVTGSPAALQVCPASSPALSVWLVDGDHLADGTDAAEVHLRAWDGAGKPVKNQPGRLEAQLGYVTGAFEAVSVSTPVWSAEDQDYVVRVTSGSALTANVLVGLDGGQPAWSPPIRFRGGTGAQSVSLSLSGDVFGLYADPCGPGSALPRNLAAAVTVRDADGNPVAGASVDWDADAPLLVGAATGVTGPDGVARVQVSADVKQLVPGQAAVRATVNNDGDSWTVTALVRLILARDDASYTAGCTVWTQTNPTDRVDPINGATAGTGVNPPATTAKTSGHQQAPTGGTVALTSPLGWCLALSSVALVMAGLVVAAGGHRLSGKRQRFRA